MNFTRSWGKSSERLIAPSMRLIISIAVCLGVAVAGSLMTTPSLRPWYAGLRKPRWAPPNWLFGPAWTFLDLSMAVAAWLVWNKVGLKSFPMSVFLVQLFLSLIWSGLFFSLRSPGLAFVDIVLLWCAIFATIFEFWSVVPAALVPYLIWVGFAAALNYSIWRLNA